MKSKARREIDKWVKNNVKNPVYLAEGQVFLWPSSLPNGPTHYLVTWMYRQTPKRVFEEFACSCKGFYFSERDQCRHIRELREQISRKGGVGGKGT
jgi:hypothetical protein